MDQIDFFAATHGLQHFSQSLKLMMQPSFMVNITPDPSCEPATVSVRSYRRLTCSDLNALPRKLFASMMRNRIMFSARGSVEETDTALESAEDWLAANCDGFYHIRNSDADNTCDLIITFENETDLVHFTLRSETP